MIMATMMALSACTAEAQGDAQTEGMVLIKGGSFQMGSPTTEAERDADEELHQKSVADFLMSATEVSQQEYEAVMGSNPSQRQGNNLPVENVTWYDAIAYCNALSQREGLTPCYEVSGTTVTWRLSANGYLLHGVNFRGRHVFWLEEGVGGLPSGLYLADGAGCYALCLVDPGSQCPDAASCGM